MHPPSPSISFSRSFSATHAWPTCKAAPRVALPAPQQPLQTRQSSQQIHLQEKSPQPASMLQKSAPSIEESLQLATGLPATGAGSPAVDAGVTEHQLPGLE
ncbi:unnamed protein product [Peronospora destructor]|uniref:Uncharacterized protein n=1 Tax=Peronospora destructor TaxID=86335 RepID=A0AAV0T1U1_9STRA|nr:unnamed protein product [Peronospora destructor]